MTVRADVVISIRPEYWHLITIGRKNVELRKSYPIKLIGMDQRSNSGFTAAVHVSGIPGVSGFMHIYEITTFRSRLIAGSGLSEADFEKYANGVTVFGWCLDQARKLEQTIPLEAYGIDRTPQSWCYAHPQIKQLLAYADRDTALYANQDILLPAT